MQYGGNCGGSVIVNNLVRDSIIMREVCEQVRSVNTGCPAYTGTKEAHDYDKK